MSTSYQISDYRRLAGEKLRSVPGIVTILRAVTDVFRVAVINFINDNDLLWASALTYTVTLSIVPIMALAFSALKGLGGSERIEPLINTYLTLGSTETTNYLMNYINNVNAATLGSVGGAALLLTVVSTLGTIENAFNRIWRVPAGRSYLRKFTDYLSVVFTVPLLMVAALTITASFSTSFHNVPGMTLALPTLIVWAGFFFLYIFFPYTKVRWDAALSGSFVAAVLFQFAQWAYVHFQVGVAGYRAIYGALATIPMILLWIYVGWSIVLFGVEICFAVQKGEHRSKSTAPSLNQLRYAVLLTLVRLAERFSNRRVTVTTQSLAAEIGVAPEELEQVVGRLRQAGLLIEASRDHPGSSVGLFLTVDPATIKLGDVLSTAESDDSAAGDPRIAGLLRNLEKFEAERLNTLTLGDLTRGASIDQKLAANGVKAAPQPASQRAGAKSG